MHNLLLLIFCPADDYWLLLLSVIDSLHQRDVHKSIISVNVTYRNRPRSIGITYLIFIYSFFSSHTSPEWSFRSRAASFFAPIIISTPQTDRLTLSSSTISRFLVTLACEHHSRSTSWNSPSVTLKLHCFTRRF